MNMLYPLRKGKKDPEDDSEIMGLPPPALAQVGRAAPYSASEGLAWAQSHTGEALPER